MSNPTLDAMDLSPADQAELQSFLEVENQKARLQQTVHTFTELCVDKCLPGKPGSKLSAGEESCLSNCVQRFLDTNMFIVKRLGGGA